MPKSFIISCFLLLLLSHYADGQSNQGKSASGYITSMPPPVPIIAVPSDLAQNLVIPVLFIWESQIHTTSYSIQISDKSDFSFLTIQESGLTDTTLTVSDLENDQTYYWKINASNRAGESAYSSAWSFSTATATNLDWEISSIPEEFALYSPYPNPSRARIFIYYDLPREAKISIAIFSRQGQLVKELVSGTQQPGRHSIIWNGKNNQETQVADGHYICVFKTGNKKFSKTVVILK